MSKILNAKTLNDSEKQQLVEKKKQLNQDISRSVDKLFKAKDAWNGKPAPEIGVTEPHSITQPIPEEALRAMDEVLDVLNRSGNLLKQISNEQSGQAKKKIEVNKQREHTQLDLSSIASSSVSRFLSHIKAPFQFGDSNKWARLKLLRSASSAKKHLEDMNSLILTNSDMAVPQAVYKAKDLFYILDNEIFEPIMKSLKDLPEVQKNPIQKIPEQQNQIELQERDPNSNVPYEYLEIEYGLKSIREELRTLKLGMIPEKFKPFEQTWKDLNRKRDYVLSLLKNNYTTAEIEYKNLLKELENFKNIINNGGFEKEANKFTRFLKRKKIEYLTLPTNHQKSIRLRADDQIQNMYYIIDNLMDILENDNVDFSSLSKFVSKLAQNMKGLYGTIANLGEIYNSDIKLLKHKSRKDNKKTPLDSISNTDLNLLRRMMSSFNDISIKIDSLKEQRE